MFPFARYLCIFTFRSISVQFCSIECILKCLIKDCFNHSRFLIKPIIPRIIQNHIRLADAYIVTPIIILVSPSNFDNNDFKSFCKILLPKIPISILKNINSNFNNFRFIPSSLYQSK